MTLDNNAIMEMADKIVKVTKNLYAKMKKHPHTFHMWYKDGKVEVFLLQDMFKNDDTKDIAGFFMRNATTQKRDQLAFVMFTSEAWIVKSPTDDIGIRPSHHPDRKEVIQFILETAVGIWAKTVYVKDGQLTGEEADWTEVSDTRGRLVSYGLVDKTGGMYR